MSFRMQDRFVQTRGENIQIAVFVTQHPQTVRLVLSGLDKILDQLLPQHVASKETFQAVQCCSERNSEHSTIVIVTVYIA